MTTNTQPEKTKCLSHQPGRNCPLDNKDADPNTFCEAYKQGDGYICNAVAKDDPVEEKQIAKSIVPFDRNFNRRNKNFAFWEKYIPFI